MHCLSGTPQSGSALTSQQMNVQSVELCWAQTSFDLHEEPFMS